MKISIVSLFPELYQPFLSTSLLRRAQQQNLVSVDVVNFFSYCAPKERIDGPTFGHGAGVLIRPEVVERAIEDKLQQGSAFKIFFSPQGQKLNQPLLKTILEKVREQNNHLLLVTARYEGIDTRAEEFYADMTVSVGDFVVMGGDVPAMLLMEGLLRNLPGVVGKEESVAHDSFSGPFVDWPEYTQPVEWKGMRVPDVLRSGNHSAMADWRERKAAEKTVLLHFDWVRSSLSLTDQQKKLAAEYIPHHYMALMHDEVNLPGDKVGTSSVTSLDLHDIARSSCTYGIKNYFVVTPLGDQQKIVQKLLDFWQSEVGIDYNKQRHEAVSLIRMVPDLASVVADITHKEGVAPVIIATSARTKDLGDKAVTYHEQARVWAKKRPVLLVFGTGNGLSSALLDRCDFVLLPVCGFTDYNHLSVRSAVAVVLDRWLGMQPRQS